MIGASQIRKMWMMALLLITAFLGLGFRLVVLQVVRHEELKMIAQGNTLRDFIREPTRGEIRDSRGNLLATSRLVKTVCADPTLLTNPYVGDRRAEVCRLLSPLLQLPEADLNRLLQIRMVTNKFGKAIPDQFVVLKRRLRVEEWDHVSAAMQQLSFGVDEKKLPSLVRPHYKGIRTRAIFAADDQLREYPNQTRAAHLIGYVGVEEHRNNLVVTTETQGKDGLEFTLNALLTGVRGWRQTEMDRAKRELVALRKQEVAPRAGLNAILTVDLGVQSIVEEELAEVMRINTPMSASAIVVRPATGEILAMATLPNFNPNDPGASAPDARRNRVIADLSEPGSTFKIVVVAGALNDGLITLQEQVDCEQGNFYYAGRTLHDHDKGYGLLSVEEVVTHSSNIGAAKIGLKIGPERLFRYVRTFGFGERTGIPLPGERLGTVHALTNWTKISITRIPMGQEVSVTPLQMVMAMSAIANQGRLMRPMLVNRLEDEQGNVVVKYQPQMIRQVCREEAATQMVTALKTVVATNGTAPKARLENYTVAGKTGTAQKANKFGYLPGKYFSSFIGFFPADQPAVCISVVLDEPKQGHYGGQIAAPVFKNIAERLANYLNIRPEFLKGDSLVAEPIPVPLNVAPY